MRTGRETEKGIVCKSQIMDKSAKVERYFEEEHQFKSALAQLRELALKTELQETYKWNFPTYTLNNKNVLALCKFKNHFGIWFFNGVFLRDEAQVLENAQEGKTQAMRHWKFYSESDIDAKMVIAYMLEAIDNQKKGIEYKSVKKSASEEVEIPELLKKALVETGGAQEAFEHLSNYRKKEYAEYIGTAKRDSTKLSRLTKILPLILEGKGLHDAYR